MREAAKSPNTISLEHLEGWEIARKGGEGDVLGEHCERTPQLGVSTDTPAA